MSRLNPRSIEILNGNQRQIPADAARCERCDSGRMIKKTGTYGEFMGCSTYPECCGTTGVNGQRRDFSRARAAGIQPAQGSLNRRVEVLEELLANAIERIESLEYYLSDEEAA
jgi:ssDNA-binding Zn-finger/Zn-ribbon topoisomerase 1